MYIKSGYLNFYRSYNVLSIHLYAFLGAGNFTKVVRVCANSV
jgi:hypothetical protein